MELFTEEVFPVMSDLGEVHGAYEDNDGDNGDDDDDDDDNNDGTP